MDREFPHDVPKVWLGTLHEFCLYGVFILFL